MVRQSIAFGGISTEPEVKKALEMCKAKSKEPGEIILHEELEASFGARYKTDRYNSCKQAFIKAARREFGWILSGQGEAMGKGVKILCGDDKLKFGISKGRSGVKMLRKSKETLVDTTDEELEKETDRKIRDFAIFQLAKIADAGRESYRMIASAIKKPELLPKLEKRE